MTRTKIAHNTLVPRIASAATLAVSLAATGFLTFGTSDFSNEACDATGGSAAVAHNGVPEIATIDTRTGRYVHTPGAAMGPAIDHYVHRAAAPSVNTYSPSWPSRLAAFDLFIRGQRFAVAQSLRLN